MFTKKRLQATVGAVAILSSSALWSDRSSHKVAMNHYERGYRAFHGQRFDEAAFWFGRAANLSPTQPSFRVRISGRNHIPYLPVFFRGLSYFALGLDERGLEEFSKAEDLWSGLPDRQQRSLRQYSAVIASLRRLTAVIDSCARDLNNVWDEHTETRTTVEQAQLQLTHFDDTARLMSSRIGTLGLERPHRRSVRTLEQTAREVETLCSDIGAQLRSNRAADYLRLDIRPASWNQSQSRTQPPDRQVREFHSELIGDIEAVYTGKSALIVAPSYKFLNNVDELSEKRITELKTAFSLLGLHPNEVKVLDKDLKKQDLWNAVLKFVEKRAPRSAKLEQTIHERPLVEKLIILVLLGHGCAFTDDGIDKSVFATAETRACPASPEELEKTGINVDDFLLLSHRPTAHIFVLAEGCGSGVIAEDGRNYSYIDPSVAIKNPMFVLLGTGEGAPENLVRESFDASEALSFALAGCNKTQEGRTVTLGYDLQDYVQRKTLSIHGGRIFGGRSSPEDLRVWKRGDLALITKGLCSSFEEGTND